MPVAQHSNDTKIRALESRRIDTQLG